MRRVDYRVKWSRRRSFGTILAIFGLGIAAVAAVPLYNNLTGAPTSHDRVDSIRAEVHEISGAGPAPNRSTQLNGLLSSLNLIVPFLILSFRTFS